MELSRQDTKMLQGLSVLAMVWLHLFDTYDYAGKFVPMVFLFGTPLVFYVAQLCDFCVFGFAFCSGYGHMLQSEQKHWYVKRLKALAQLILAYWVILAVFAIVGLLAGQGDFMPGSWRKLLLNALLIESSYNGAWWYLFAYAVIVLISPAVILAVKKGKPVLVIAAGVGIYAGCYLIRFRLGGGNWFLSKLGPFGMTLFEYLCGLYCCRYRVFSALGKQWKRLSKAIRLTVAAVLLLILLYARTKILPNMIFAPVSGFAVMALFHFWNKPGYVQKAMLYIGKHSTNIWLTHMFFYSVLFTNLVYAAKYPLLVFGLMLLITIPLSEALLRIQKPIQGLVGKK